MYFGNALNVITFNLEIFYPLYSVVLEIGLLTHQYSITEILFIIGEVMFVFLFVVLIIFKKKKKVFKMEKEFGDCVNDSVRKEDNERRQHHV